MNRQTSNFDMTYFGTGDTYSAKVDQNRFLTVDYNLNSYVGIVGVGIISGWTISANVLSELTIDIFPGKGIINNFYAETDYVFLQRSDMTIGQIETEVVNTSIAQQPYLDNAQRATYISVIQAYNPSFENPDLGDEIINEYVKVCNTGVPSSQLVLSDNTDTYITATLTYPNNYIMSAIDYPSVIDEPIAVNYNSYSDFANTAAIYNSQIANVHSYQWRDYPENHYDIVTYGTSATLPTDPNTILLAKVSTRGGVITTVDTSGINNLAGMNSTITAMARQVISNHQHGGNKPSDPPAINLQTDTRKLALRTINNNKMIFDILENTPTSIELGHTHSYRVDSTGTDILLKLMVII